MFCFVNFSHQLQAGCSVNVYLVHGGTNFGFSSSTGVDANGLQSYYTSYDFDALISESGDITDKYHAVRNVIKKHMPIPSIAVPRNESKMALPPVKLRPRTSLFSPWSRHLLGSDARQSKKPLVFENFTQDAGFLLYETQLDGLTVNSSVLNVTGLHDRAIVYLNYVSEIVLHLEDIQKGVYNGNHCENLFRRHLSVFCHEKKQLVPYESTRPRGICCKF